MPNNPQIIFTVGSLPPGFCPTSEQERVNGYIAQLSGVFPGTLNTFNFGNGLPTADNQDKPWIRTTSTGAFDRIFTFSGGAWISPHPSPAAVGGIGNEVRMWRGLLADLDTYDGGLAGAVTATTGPFWTEVTEMRFKSPFGVGSGAIHGGTLAVAVKGAAGAIEHAIGLTEMPSHTHATKIPLMAPAGGTIHGVTTAGSTSDESYTSDPTGGDAAKVTVPMSLLHPVYGIYFIQRTARVFYKI